MRNPRLKKMLMFAPLAIIGFALFIALGGELVRQLWNWLLPSLFGFKTITFWQGLGLLALCRILFGGFRLHGGRGGRGWRGDERWNCMTAEEKERVRQGMRERFNVRTEQDPATR
jgi:hypothetical protein